MGRSAYGFEIEKSFYREAKEKMLNDIQCATQITLF
jgi:hypothetical protein